MQERGTALDNALRDPSVLIWGVVDSNSSALWQILYVSRSGKLCGAAEEEAAAYRGNQSTREGAARRSVEKGDLKRNNAPKEPTKVNLKIRRCRGINLMLLLLFGE